MDIDRLLAREWPEWRAVARLGEGSYGAVYHVRRQDMAGTYDAALKVTRIPRDEEERRTLRMEGLSEAQCRSYYAGVARSMAAEIRAMEAVKGYTNIVSIEDYRIIEDRQAQAWYILIRMELLTPLDKRQSRQPLTEAEVVRLGRDLCTALAVCRSKSILHRDIKPENVFINAHGDFVLGDFGAARNVDHLTSRVTRKGTYNYMAPELFNNNLGAQDIDSAARMDIYSLGMVMYQLLNGGRLPLTDGDAAPTTHQQQKALLRRMKGEALPPPPGTSPWLARIVLKACAFDPGKRYATAEAMRRDLERGNDRDGEDDKPRRTRRGREKREAVKKPADPARRGLRIVAAVIALVLLLGIAGIVSLLWSQ